MGNPYMEGDLLIYVCPEKDGHLNFLTFFNVQTSSFAVWHRDNVWENLGLEFTLTEDRSSAKV